jgi:hypothetical protein
MEEWVAASKEEWAFGPARATAGASRIRGAFPL